MRKPVALATTAALLSALAALASPAQAAEGVTSVSFQVSTGTLTITAAASAPEGAAQLDGSGATVTIPLGTTTVRDTRSGLTGWTMTARASDFVSGSETIAKTQAKFSVQNIGVTAPSGTALLSVPTNVPPVLPTAVNGTGSLVLMQTALTLTSNGIGFEPVLTVDVPAATAAGLYTGTVTQSVV